MKVTPDGSSPIHRTMLSESQTIQSDCLFTAEYRKCIGREMIKRLRKCRQDTAKEQTNVNTARTLSFMRLYYRLRINAIDM
jgi:hypothetical protein